MMSTNDVRPSPFFIADDRALDFLNSVAAPWGKEIEWLNDGGDFVNWLEQSTLISDSMLTQFRQQFTQPELDKVAMQARELREWFREFVSRYAGKPLSASVFAELAPLNHILAQDSGYRQIEVNLKDIDLNGSSLRWRQERRWSNPDMLLIPLAEIIGHLICHADFSRLRNCEGPTCTLWFLDVSKNHTRRWCTMSVCGNRAKAAAYRAKKSATKK